MGHIGEKGLQDVKWKCMVEGLPIKDLEVDFYEHWIYGRLNHFRSMFGTTREKRNLELAHSDVFGIVPV